MIFDDERMWRSWALARARAEGRARGDHHGSEDRRFYRHGGFDPRGAARALTVNLVSHGAPGRQHDHAAARSRAVPRPQANVVARKLAESPTLVRARGDAVQGPDPRDVPELGVLGTGARVLHRRHRAGGAVVLRGADRVARRARGATLAAMIPAPNALDPFENPERVRERRNTVLNDMVETHDLPAATAATLAARPLGLRRGRTPVERFPPTRATSRPTSITCCAAPPARHQGWSVFTTMDVAWQAQAEEEIERGLEGLDALRAGGSRASGRVRRARSGDLDRGRAMVGGRAMETGRFQPRQAGEAADRLGDQAHRLRRRGARRARSGSRRPPRCRTRNASFGRGRWAWQPRNYDGSYHDEVTVAKALGSRSTSRPRTWWT